MSKPDLKMAKNAMKEGHFQNAMACCQSVLKEDRRNYTALVLLSAAMSKIDEWEGQADLTLKKAVEIDPDKPLAWRGLVSFYEKQPDKLETWQSLLPAYYRILEIDRDSPKCVQHMDEIARIVLRMKDDNVAGQIIKSLTMLKPFDEEEKNRKIKETIATIFLHYTNVTHDFSELYRSTLTSVIEFEDYRHRLEAWKRHLRILFSEQRFQELFKSAEKMHEQYPQEIYPLEWIFKNYATQKVLNNPEFDEGMEIKKFYTATIRIDANSYLGSFAKALIFLQSGNIIDARDSLNETVSIESRQLYAWFFLIEVNAKLHCWSSVENAVQQTYALLRDKSNDLQKRVDLFFIEALVNSESKDKWNLAVDMCNKLLDENSTGHLKLLLAHAKINLEDPEANSLLSELENDPETQTKATILRARFLKIQGDLGTAMDVLGCSLETSDSWFLFGKINWELSNYDHSLMAFLKGIHADPHNWQCLVHLGHYYRQRGKDLEKSRKCYQKALRINPNSDEAGTGLSTTYRLLKNTEANMQMLKKVTTPDGGGPKWAWLQLGLQHLDEGEISEAIKSLRFVIRADPNNEHCWESLADAYWARGSHTSALKSYQRALDLSPGSIYPMIQLANINVVLGRHEEAKQAFRQVLTQEKKSILALKGLAESCLCLAVENSKKQLLGRAKRNIQEAADCLTDAIIENSNLSCLWKLLGDACYRTAILPNSYCSLEVAPGLVKSNSETAKVEIKRSELFSLSSRCYCRALSLSKDSSFLWHDLACCYLSQLRFDKNADPKDAAEKSFAAAKQAVRLNPATWVHWNVLGVISMRNEIKNYALAQHCWVMAIDREPNNAIAWTNLGTLYIHLGDPYKGNDAYSRAQRADPEYANSWIGQGLIAESVMRKEAMDLFRHASQLGYHPQAAIGYAHWVLMTVLNPESKRDPLYTYTIVNMHAITVALDAMTWFIEREPDSIIGRNALGLLLERQKLLKPASRQFIEALRLSKDQNILDKVRVNLSRVLLQMGDYDGAVSACRAIKTANFNSHCQLALSLFKAEKYEESYATYENALHDLAEDGSDKAHVLCAMAAMAYMFQEVHNVKTLLFQCIQIQPPTIAGLLAAAALGLLHDDYNLTNLVLNELAPHKDDPNYRHHIAILSAYSCFINDDISGAIRVLSKAVHRYPDDVGSWVGLVRILLETDSSSFGNCAQKALYLGRKTSTVAIAQVACVSSLGQLICSNEKSGLRSVQKTLFSFPGNISSWANLVFALSSRSTDDDSTPNAEWLCKLISIIHGKLKSTKPIDEWLINTQRELSTIKAM